MTVKLKGIEIEIPEGGSVDISEDGTKIKIGFPSEMEVDETIRVVEVEGPVIETFRYVPQPQPTIINTPYVPYTPIYPGPCTPIYPGPYDPPYGPNWTVTGTTTVPMPVVTTGTIKVETGNISDGWPDNSGNESFTIGNFNSGNLN